MVRSFVLFFGFLFLILELGETRVSRWINSKLELDLWLHIIYSFIGKGTRQTFHTSSVHLPTVPISDTLCSFSSCSYMYSSHQTLNNKTKVWRHIHEFIGRSYTWLQDVEEPVNLISQTEEWGRCRQPLTGWWRHQCESLAGTEAHCIPRIKTDNLTHFMSWWPADMS